MKKNRGFTLNEVLIAVAILGILSAISYVSLTSSRIRSADLAIKTNLSGIIGISAIIYSQNNTYGGDFCTKEKVKTQIDLAKSASGITTETVTTLSTPGSNTEAVCHVSGDSWAISVPLKSNPNDSWCLDSGGQLKEKIGHLGIGGLSC